MTWVLFLSAFHKLRNGHREIEPFAQDHKATLVVGFWLDFVHLTTTLCGSKEKKGINIKLLVNITNALSIGI